MQPSTDSRPRRRVLIADDNADGMGTLASLCRIWGCEVRMAENGLSALATGESFEPGFAILDINMPGLNGYNLARCLRDTFGSSIVLIALTACNDADSRQRAKASGFDHHLVKPCDLSELEQLINA